MEDLDKFGQQYLELLPESLFSTDDLLHFEETLDLTNPFPNFLDDLLPLKSLQPTAFLSTNTEVSISDKESAATSDKNAVSSSSDRHARFVRTAEILSRSGLLDITMKTAELVRRNQQLDKELEALKKETAEFVQSVLTNSENIVQNYQTLQMLQ